MEGGAEVRLRERRELRLEGTGRTGQMKGKVDRAGFSQQFVSFTRLTAGVVRRF